MSRIAPLPESEATDKSAQTYGRLKDFFGDRPLPDVFLPMGRVPAFLSDFYMNFKKFVASPGALDVPTKATIALAVALKEGSTAWSDFYGDHAKANGLTDDQILADGLMETMASSLTTIEQFERGLRVVPPSEIRRERIESARQARQAFGATLAISGSLRREGDALKLTFHLIDTAQIVQLASRTIELPAGENQGGLQQLVAATVAGLLDLQLRPEASRAMTAGGSNQPGAYLQFARGRGYLQRFDRGVDHVDLAIDAFGQAIKADPKFALAYAALAESYWRKYEISRQPVWLDRAEEHAEQALAINPRLPTIHVVLAMIARGRIVRRNDRANGRA